MLRPPIDRIALMFATLAIVVSTACSTDKPDREAPFVVLDPTPTSVAESQAARLETQIMLNENRQRWASQNIRDYTFELVETCMVCPRGWVLITVKGARIESAIEVNTSEAVSTTPRYPRSVLPSTIERLFTAIHNAAHVDTYRVVAEYDLQLGYPTKASFDWILTAVDDETEFSVRRLKVEATPPATP